MYKDLLKLFKTGKSISLLLICKLVGAVDIATVEKASRSMVQSGTVSGTPVVEG